MPERYAPELPSSWTPPPSSSDGPAEDFIVTLRVNGSRKWVEWQFTCSHDIPGELISIEKA